jgi:hypothetical protein
MQELYFSVAHRRAQPVGQLGPDAIVNAISCLSRKTLNFESHSNRICENGSNQAWCQGWPSCGLGQFARPGRLAERVEAVVRG